MPSRGISSRRATDLIVVAIIYAIVLVGSFAFVVGVLRDNDGIPDITSSATAILLTVTPAVLLGILIVTGVKFVLEYRRKAWGYRLRARVVLAFLLVSGMAAVPTTVFLGMLAIRAVELPASFTVRSALSSGMEFTLAYYSEKEAALKYITENDVSTAIATRGMDAGRVLARLSARDPSICAVELFSGGMTIGFAGDESVRSVVGTTLMDRNGFLPRLAVQGKAYARYYDTDVGTNGEGQLISAMVALRFSERVEDTADILSTAFATMTSSGQRANSFSIYWHLPIVCSAQSPRFPTPWHG